MLALSQNYNYDIYEGCQSRLRMSLNKTGKCFTLSVRHDELGSKHLVWRATRKGENEGDKAAITTSRP